MGTRIKFCSSIIMQFNALSKNYSLATESVATLDSCGIFIVIRTRGEHGFLRRTAKPGDVFMAPTEHKDRIRAQAGVLLSPLW